MTTIPVETIHDIPLLQGALPGEPVPYYLASGDGARFETAGQLWTVIARASDSGGAFDAAYIEGPRGAASPFYSLPDVHRTYTVLNGQAEVWVGGESRMVARGDSVQVPEGVPFAYRFSAPMTRLLLFSAPGGALDALLASGASTSRRIYSARGGADEPILPERATLHPQPDAEASHRWDGTRPSGVNPYVLSGFGGDHREWPDTMNSIVVRGENTGGRYFAVHTLAARAPYIIRHFHRQHTENFLCLSGRIWLWVNGQEVLLTEGDFLHAPAGTIHSFAIGANNSRMLGFLTTDVFEPFFDVTAVPSENDVYTEGLVDPSTMFAGMAAHPDLDLEVVGPPPTRVLAPEL